MPVRSKAQARLMAAAAHTKGGYGGVSQAVGREFVPKGSHIPKGLPAKKRPAARRKK